MSIITIVPKIQFPVITFEIKENGDELINFGDHYYYIKHLKTPYKRECILYYTSNTEVFKDINDFVKCCDNNVYICKTLNKSPKFWSQNHYSYNDHNLFKADSIQNLLFSDRFLQKDNSALMLRNTKIPITNMIKIEDWLNYEIDYENLIIYTNCDLDLNNTKVVYDNNMRMPLIKICSEILSIYPEFDTIRNVYTSVKFIQFEE